MKAWLKKILIVFVIAAINLLTSDIHIDANTIDSITMDIYLEDNGTGHVTEIWNMKVNNGTEVYKPYSNLENYNITNLKVKDDSGKVYTTISDWNTGANFVTKMYKCGILNTSDGVEICWGITSYGSKVYMVEYDIEGLVQQLSDSQSIYFCFFPENMDPSPRKVMVSIDSKVDFNEENAKIWAYGYDGEINFKDGNIVMEVNGPLGYSEYMVALIKFEENFFTPTIELNKTFSTIQSEAMEGSDYEEEENNSITSSNFSILEMIATLLGTLVFIFGTFMSGPIFVIVVFVILIYLAKRPKEGSLYFGDDGKTLPSMKTVDYYRDVPCDGNIYKAYFIVEHYFTFLSEDDKKSGLMGAMLLKWIKEKRVNIVKTRGGLFNLRKDEFALDLKNLTPTEDDVEKKLIYILKEASGANEVLEVKEFEKWCYSKYRIINNWFDYASKNAIKEYVKEGKIVEREVQTKTLLGTRNIKQNFVNSEIKEQAIQMLGLRRFLLDYSLIAQREPIEVMLWENYLIFAQILNIADKVESQFSKIYPDFGTNNNLSFKDINKCVKSITYKGVIAASRARSSSSSSGSSSRSRSSGGGGRSSRGGGRSSGGRSRGGGVR